ncbi:helix-turn-helix domain-containing protein [Emticicia sp. BO119]|uniref:helix-turn-helix domain-containing protein n=1 Tax=Emticicia sp. BO119 TaxID=2757768 RepID=UPI0015F09629|nr:helix-turn-helix domain-containing protein [Emticicia sp. BO119]MBA4851521.1 helix-turn-helix domain-containing protein [Emticicia sp. BO119]
MDYLLSPIRLNELEILIQNSLEKALKNQSNISSIIEDKWLDLNGLCAYLPDKPVKPTVYTWVHNSIIPYHKKGKKLFFLKSEIDQWLKEGRKKTKFDIKEEADLHLSKLRKKGGRQC